MGQLTIKVFSCVALISVIKYLEPLIGNTLLRFVDIPPKATVSIFVPFLEFRQWIDFLPSDCLPCDDNIHSRGHLQARWTQDSFLNLLRRGTQSKQIHRNAIALHGNVIGLHPSPNPTRSHSAISALHASWADTSCG